VMRQIRRIAAVVVLLMARSVQASAQSSYVPPSFLSSVSGLWTVAVGVNVVGQPAFDGGKGNSFSVSPILSIGRAGGSAERFRSQRDSSSIALFDDEGFSAGPAGKLKEGRTASSHTELNGLGDVDRTLEVGGFVQYFPVDWFRLRAEVRQGFGGHHGVVADFSADAIVPIWQRLTLSGGPRFTWESTQATAPYFGIDAAQALASGLPAFDAKDGAHSVGAGTQLRYQINPQWEAHAYVEYERLLGDAAASPLVTQRGSPNQTSFGLGASYAFDVRVP
jgi:MipA family protein